MNIVTVYGSIVNHVEHCLLICLTEKDVKTFITNLSSISVIQGVVVFNTKSGIYRKFLRVLSIKHQFMEGVCDKDDQFWDLYTTLWQFKNATFWCKPPKNWMSELWTIYQCWKQYETKEFELFLCQYLKNNICKI